MVSSGSQKSEDSDINNIRSESREIEDSNIDEETSVLFTKELPVIG